MGSYDIVNVPCPKCGTVSHFQSKSGPCCLMEYDLVDCPADILQDVNRHAPDTYTKCGTQFYVQFKTQTVVIQKAVVIEWCAACHKIAEEDGDILPPACPAHGGPSREGEIT